jgi:ACS family tartrate transporter-like MFS transporter
MHMASALFLAVAGIALSTVLSDPIAKVIAFAVAGAGIFGCLPVFWTMPTAFLSGAAAAGGIAIINSIGNLAGFAGRYVVGRIKDLTGSFAGGLPVLAAVGVVGVLVVVMLSHDTRLEQAPGGEPRAAE